MKKTLIALAVMASATTAMAQDSSVSLYGVVDMGLSHQKAGNDSVTGVDSGLQSGSRLGIKGTEKLGNGLTAKFVLESGLNADTGGYAQENTAFGRQAWLGVEGGFGEVRLGRQYTPIREAVVAIDPFALGGAGNAGNVAFGGAGGPDAGFGERANNAITYIAPKNNLGLSASVQYAMGERDSSVSDGSELGLSLGYSIGAATLGFAYQDKDNSYNSYKEGVKNMVVGGMYDFGVAKAHVAYTERKNEQGSNSLKQTSYLLGVSAPVGSVGTLKASYVTNKMKGVADSTSTQFAVGYDHALSKRTNLYASLAHVSNDDRASLVSGMNGENATTYQVGVRHAF